MTSQLGSHVDAVTVRVTQQALVAGWACPPGQHVGDGPAPIASCTWVASVMSARSMSPHMAPSTWAWPNRSASSRAVVSGTVMDDRRVSDQRRLDQCRRADSAIRRRDWITLLLHYVINPARRLTTNNRRYARQPGSLRRLDNAAPNRMICVRLRSHLRTSKTATRTNEPADRPQPDPSPEFTWPVGPNRLMV
jgi:hypothetical protein